VHVALSVGQNGLDVSIYSLGFSMSLEKRKSFF